jgi:ubiquinone/menaquinone biosynthesis C-methylase UbiE
VPDEVRDTWSRYAAAFVAEGSAAEDRASLRTLVELCALPPGSLVVDVGCGAGYTAFAFARAGCRAIGLDPTHSMLVAVGEGWIERGLPEGARRVEAWAEALPFAAGCLDGVVAHRAPHQFRDRAGWLSEARRILHPDGVLGLADQSPPDGWEDWHNTLERLRDPTHDRSLSPREWRELVEAAGFAVLQEAVVAQLHDVEEWLDRVDCPPARRREVVDMLRDAPPEVAVAYAIGTEDGRLVMQTPQVVLAARPA